MTETPPPLPVSASGLSAIEVARQCARAARGIIRDAYGRSAVTTIKGRGNIATEADSAVEAEVTRILRREFPSHAVLSEETAASTRSDGWMWVCDPIDGTTNFSRGIPHFAFSIALCHDSKPVVALTDHPLLEDEFAAVAGQGATLNGAPMRMGEAKTIREAVVAFDLGYDDGRGTRQLQTALHLWPGMQALRITGSAALGFAYAAAGRWDLYVHLKLEAWDIAAGILLVREAGGVVTARDGSDATLFSETAIAGTAGTHADFLGLAGGLPWQA